MRIELKRAAKGVEVGRLAAGDLRAEGDGKDRAIYGVSAPYGRWTTLAENKAFRWRERYGKGCFEESIARDDVRCCFNHNLAYVLGRKSAGTLTLDPEGDGLTYSVSVNPDDPMAVGVWARVKRGDVVGASTWFMPTEIETSSRNEDGRLEIDDTIVRADLYEQGPVTDGQYSEANAAARAIIRSVSEGDYTALRRLLTHALEG